MASCLMPTSRRSWLGAMKAWIHAALSKSQKRTRTSKAKSTGRVCISQRWKSHCEGWHDHLGGLHAEQMAIHDAEEKGHNTNGAATRSSRPCNHFGRTPPCTEALLWAGISNVVIALGDPINREGKWHICIENAGIKVEIGLLEDEAAHQMREFLHWCANRKPFVTVKVAIDANGSVDDLSKGPARFTSEECLKNSQVTKRLLCNFSWRKYRNQDDPSLNVRLVESEKQPMRVVIDPNNRINSNSK